MTLTRLIGDIHGQVYDYKAYAIDNFEGPTIQIGDFGIGFGQGDYWHESVDAFHVAGGHRFIRGNHDNPALCKTMKGWIKDHSPWHRKTLDCAKRDCEFVYINLK
jgi:hypothetical protein